MREMFVPDESAGILIRVPQTHTGHTFLGLFRCPYTQLVARDVPVHAIDAVPLFVGAVMVTLGEVDSGWVRVLSPLGPGWVYGWSMELVR